MFFKHLVLSLFGAIEVVIYNFLVLITIGTNINQFIKAYHILNKIQVLVYKKLQLNQMKKDLIE